MKRGDFLKKTAAITINLRKFRPIFFSAVFLSVITLSIVLSKSLPAITLDVNAFRFFLSSNVALENEKELLSGVFSLNKKVISPEGIRETVSKDFEETFPPIETLKVPSKVSADASVEISDTTASGINADNFLSPLPSFLEEDFSVLIVHTHTTESYTPSRKFSYIPSDTDRTTDKNFNMVRVGEEIKNVLEAKGVKVYHDTSLNDHPSYSGS